MTSSKNQQTKKYFPKEIEAARREVWEQKGLHKFSVDASGEPYYVLVELPYPSGDLHIGHWFTFANADIHARYKKMAGYNVFFPNGFDAFGLPAENAAIKRNIHPQDWTMSNIENMKSQFSTMGTMIDWSHEAITCLPEYYKWNQWIFLKMLEKGIAYRGKALSNWCPVDQTVLANEHVEDGKCWRCGSEIEQKEISQWFLRITEYADELIWPDPDVNGLSNGVDWPQSVREGQNNWIGRSEGAVIRFDLADNSGKIEVFTTRPDTLFGATFMVIAPEHPIAEKIVKGEYDIESDILDRVKAYVLQAKKKTERERKEGTDEKTGVFTGVYAKHPVTGEKIPVWIADYVLATYGTGAIMAVPAHDDRDFAFASKFDLPIVPVIRQDKENVIVIHGCPSDEKDSEFAGHWMPWLKKELEAKGFDITIPIMPTPWKPEYKKWKEEFEKLSITEHTTLIGHSCGAAFLVKWLSDTGKKVKKLILVGPAKIPDPMGDKRIQLYDFEIDEKLREHVEQVVIFTSDTELERHRKSAQLYHEKLGGKYHELPKMGHYTLEDMGTAEFPELLKEVVTLESPYVGPGVLVNSGEWNGWEVPGQIGKTIEWLDERDLGKKKVQYHLRDWSVSRQRYWGTPVPIIHCEQCGIVPVPEKDLPVELPYEVDYQPKGKPPLATATDWVNVRCPKCGGPGKRETETLDTFFDSSWYYYRYLNPNYDREPFDTRLARLLMPVDVYIGGSEHTLGHTLYARFFTKFFHDIGLIDFEEFADKRIQHGVILGPDGYRMSKSRGNVVNPDDVVAEYGADAVRLYLAFMMPFEATAPWNTSAISGVYRFLKRVWELENNRADVSPDKSDQIFMHKTIKKVGEDMDQIKFNTAVAALMEWLNHLGRKESVSHEEYRTMLLLLAPLAPHMTDELWERIGEKGSIHEQGWPAFDEGLLAEDTVTIAVQVNGKMREVLHLQRAQSEGQSEVEAEARRSDKIMRYLKGKEVRKVIYIPGRAINFVVN